MLLRLMPKGYFCNDDKILFESSPLVGNVDQESQHHGRQHRHIDQDVVASLMLLRAKVWCCRSCHYSILLLMLLVRRNGSTWKLPRPLGPIPRKDVQVPICRQTIQRIDLVSTFDFSVRINTGAIKSVLGLFEDFILVFWQTRLLVFSLEPTIVALFCCFKSFITCLLIVTGTTSGLRQQ